MLRLGSSESASQLRLSYRAAQKSENITLAEWGTAQLIFLVLRMITMRLRTKGPKVD
jgi:hypothetical protein